MAANARTIQLPVAMSEKALPLEERMMLLTDELVLAAKWHRPSILLVVYRSELVRRAARKLLVAQLSPQGDALCPITVTPDNYDVLRALVARPASRSTVFEISGLRHGPGKYGAHTYQALNLRRELLVERGLRTIFWLTQAEARQLPRQAPDFWAFRHRVVSLVDLQWKGGMVRHLPQTSRQPGSPGKR
jgi:hypothetical protein